MAELERLKIMNNFEHDIPSPQDKAIRYYLWQDYFHDSIITDVKQEYQQVTLCLLCEREESAYYHRCKGTHEEKRAKCEEMAAQFRYKIIFQMCGYSHHEQTCDCPDYINGRFKRSALLAKIEAATGKLYYHFRIQTGDGYFEAVCRNIRIKKEIGHIHPRETEDWCWTGEWLTKYEDGALLDDSQNISISAVLNLAESENDIDRYFALTFLAKHDAEHALLLARKYILMESDDVLDCKIPAIWALGEFGDESDIAALLHECAESEIAFARDSIGYCGNLTHHRNIMDAIEKIQYRIYRGGKIWI